MLSNQGDARLRNVACPSCGAPVRFRGATSIVAVCPFCKSTLVREGVKLEDIGKQAELLEDHSPIRIGAEGTPPRHRLHRRRAHPVQVRRGRLERVARAVPRQQERVALGRQPRVHDHLPDPAAAAARVRGDEARPAARAQGRQVVRRLLHGDEHRAGRGGRRRGRAAVQVPAGWKANVVDLRGEGARFATIDYSETPPHLYVGEKLPFDTFSLLGPARPRAGRLHPGHGARLQVRGLRRADREAPHHHRGRRVRLAAAR